MPKRIIFFLLSVMPVTAVAQQQVSLLRSRLNAEPDSIKINVCLEISRLYAESQPDSAVDYCNRGMRLAEKRNDRHGQALLLLQLGRINALHHHDELARKFDNESLSIFRSLNEMEGVAQSYDELGLLDGQQHNISMATRDLNQARKFYRNAHDTAGILETYHWLGEVYEEKGENEQALSYYLRALIQYERRAQKPPAYFVLLKRIGLLYVKKGDSETALRYLSEGVVNGNIARDGETQITLLDEEGKIYEDKGEQARALLYYKQALADAKKFNRPEEQAKALISIANVLKKKNALQSLGDLRMALKIASGLNEPQLEASIYDALAGVYRQEKDYKEALIALEENHRLVDSLLEADTTKEIAELDSSYMLERSREQVGSLQRVNREEKIALNTGFVIMTATVIILIMLWLYLRKINRLNKALQSSNEVRDTLFSIIGHDLKGPVGASSQLVTMMATEHFSEAELRAWLPDLATQTSASAELLNALFEWGSAQLKGIKVTPAGVATKSLIGKNISLLSQQAAVKNITISDNTPEYANVFADPDHVNFIFRNLLSNAIKFTYEGGSIDIACREEGRDIVYSVKDTGKGISIAQQQAFLKTNLKVSFGTKGEKGSGLGLLLIKEFVQANKGRIWLESAEGKGTIFFVSFPKNED